MTEQTGRVSVQVGGGEDSGQAPKEREVAVSELFLWVYRFFYSKTVGLILILVFAFYAVIGSVIGQMGPETVADPEMRAQAVEQMRATYGGWTPILDALGFFHVFTSLGFYIIVGLLALSIIACTVHRIPELVRRVREPRLHVSKQFFKKARYRGAVVTSHDADDAFLATRRVLKKNRFRVISDPRDPGRALYADRNSWSGIGTVIAHLSFIVILLAFLISAKMGIEEDLAVPVGGDVEIGHGVEGTIHAVSFQDVYTDEGRPADYVSVLQIRSGDQVIQEQEVRVNSPLSYGGFRFHQSTFGMAADVLVASPEGEELFAEAVPLKWNSNDGANALGRFEIPGTDLEVIVVLPASGRSDSTVPVGSAVFELYQGDEGTPVDIAPAVQGEPTQVGGYTLTFERERQYTGIRMRHDPGTPWMWFGSTLLVVGMCITFLFPYRRLWSRVDEAEDGGSEVLFGAVSRLDYSYQRMFERLVAEVDQDLGHKGIVESEVASTSAEGESADE